MEWGGRNAKSGRNIKKMKPFLFSSGLGKRPYFVGWQMLRFLGPEFILNHKKISSGKEGFDFWLISGWFGWVVGSLWVFWLVLCGLDDLYIVWMRIQ